MELLERGSCRRMHPAGWHSGIRAKRSGTVITMMRYILVMDVTVAESVMLL